MKETFVRPLWNKIFCILFTLVQSEILLFAVLYFFIGFLSADWNLKRNTIFGYIPIWIPFFIVFQIFTPFFMIPLYEIMFRFKYDREYKKNLIPFYTKHIEQPMLEAKKHKGFEPVWKENYEFEARLKLFEIGYFCGRHPLAKVVDTNTGILYFMFATRWTPDDNGCMVGNFTFDTNWKISNIYKVD